MPSPADEGILNPQVYVLDRAFGAGGPKPMARYSAEMVIRARSHPERLIVSLTQQYGLVHSLRWLQPWEDRVGLTPLRQSHDFVALVFVGFAAFGVLLALVGIYGVVAHSVAQRTREFGVRVALGAEQRDILALVLHEGNVVTLLGVASGLLLSHWATKLIEFFLYGVEAADQMLVLSVAPIGVFVAATLATALPALRAARVNPVEALRND